MKRSGLDTLSVRGLAARTFIGILPHERRAKQKIAIDLELRVDTRRAAKTECIEDTVDYARVSAAVLSLVEGRKFDLIETLASEIAALVLSERAVASVCVTVHKPAAVAHAEDVTLTIERSGGTRRRSPAP